jgi:hypothetical protein
MILESIERLAGTSIGLYLMLSPKLYALKSEAFREEKEWRLISNTFRDEYDFCLFRALNDRIVPYMVFDLAKLQTDSITKIKIGPKNLTPSHVIESILKKYGFNNATISRSSATYR